MSEQCTHRSGSGCTCGAQAVTYIDGLWLCAIHAQMVAVKKGRKRGRH